ncbi:serine hydrolase domain-containing protein [Desulfuromonas carbonis]|uniref:serine hydrolase domain-containing protein n=1 Tax=Desulfuromonas sp. DDH964 TaxID=1823759 RepID=UPI00078C8272|nr:serine hydrolase [Desulfuromonas sp. DDH964]AMV71113.1 metal-dependent hydrolase [Desulfuromonas sp. DDH964]
MDSSKSSHFRRHSSLRCPAVGLLLVFLLLLPGCSGEDLGDYKQQSLDQLAAERTGSLNVPSVSIAVRETDDQVTTVVYGVEDLASATPATIHSRYRIGSLTKTFVAARILQMVEAGILRLSDTLEELLPDEAQRLANYRPGRIQLTNLLNHTSLICSFTEMPEWSGKFTSDPTYRWSPEELLEVVAPYATDSCNEPGQTWHYSNTNYVLLGKIIEKYDPQQRPYGQQLREELIDPLGLTDTFVPSSDFPDQIRWIHGYVNWDLQFAPLTDITDLDWSFTWSSGEIISTPTDLTRWIKSLLTPGVVLQAATLALMEDMVTTGLEGGYNYGLGLMQISIYGTLGHAGGHPGFDCTAQYLPEFDQAVAMCENRTLAHRQKSDTAFLGSVLRSLHPERNYPLMPGTILATE